MQRDRAEFDAVVIGAGSAGCAVAGYLCRFSNLDVCLVEAGPDYGLLGDGRWPAELLDPRRRPDTHDWGYCEERPNRLPVPERRAKVIGGCSTHNQCAAVWGPREDFDRWAAAGNPGWQADEIAPMIEEIRRAVPTAPTEDAQLASWQRCFLHAAIEAGFRRLADLSAREATDGVAPFHANIIKGTRWNAAFAFLDGVRDRRNLTILSGCLADRLRLIGPTATAVVGQSDRGPWELYARWFVLCAGTYGSPMILLRTGIGPADHLRELGIPVLLDRPGVGQNLHDHVGVRVRYDPSPGGCWALQDDVRSGHLAQSQVILRTSREDGGTACDIHVLPYLSAAESGEWAHEIMAMNMEPRSRGHIRLRGADPLLAPVIDFRLFTDPQGHDLAVAAAGLRLIRLLDQTAALRAQVNRPLEAMPDSSDLVGVRTYLEEHAARYAHAVGTCKMGPAEDPRAVVDTNGLVRGISNVVVADASIMPRIPRANTNFTCFVIGLRIARLIARMAG